MMKDIILDHLKQSKVPSSIASMLSSIGNVEEVRTKSVIVEIGAMCNRIFFVLEGGLVSQYLTESGSYKTVNFYLGNLQSFVTIPNSYFLHEKSSFRLKAITQSQVVSFEKEVLDQLVAESSEFRDWYQKKIIHTLVEEYSSKSNIITMSSKEMYQYLLREQPEVIRSVPSTYIAQYLGISREHLSRMRKEIG
ncbi:Crp/Fnr family transcriptional regulator [Halosquirtibacter xylanolyticus]|uniref:Crp/Fnr family transcriptional regulator n=1 Tax=Halosquirtibacter xylanolyticus TaxID=3374599 RepID=UPI0037498799|nr:Crp/Fnr family transcriptional regulator [Prolixibacteraceae bacterium]